MNIVEADLLVLLSDVDGYYHDLSDNAPVAEIREITDDVIMRAGGAGSVHGTGGMLTKIRAAEMVVRSGEMMIIANGRKEGILGRIMKGENTGTIFIGTNGSMKSRKRWIAFNMKTAGSLIIDDGAVEAIRDHKKSLLASGILDVRGSFDNGDAVDILDSRDEKVGKGIVNYTHQQLAVIKGKKTVEIKSILGSVYHDEVINRDDLITY